MMKWSRFRLLLAAIVGGDCLAAAVTETPAQTYPMPGTPEAFSELINSSMDTWAKVLKRADIQTLD